MTFVQIYEAARTVSDRKSMWVDLYLQYRYDNITLYIKKELDTELVKEYLYYLERLDLYIVNFNKKKRVGAYILSRICKKPVTNLQTPNKQGNTIIKII